MISKEKWAIVLFIGGATACGSMTSTNRRNYELDSGVESTAGGVDKKTAGSSDAVGLERRSEAKAPENSAATPSGDSPTSASRSFQCPRHPILLHHGFMSGSTMGSFKKAKEHFTAKGCKIFETEVNAVQTSEFRGKQLASQIGKILSESGASRVNIIAHSQGGLDARYALAAAGAAPQTASLSTISTPHFGTPIADKSLEMSGPLGQKAMALMLNLMGRAINGHTQDPDTMAAVKSLTVEYMTKTFNPQYPNANDVYYQSWSAVSGAGTQDRLKTMMLIGHTIISNASGPNDGVVPETSAHWGEFQGTLQADHLDLIGYKLLDRGGFDHLKFLEGLIIDLAKKGY